MTKPTDLALWATGGTIVVPSGAEKIAGWPVGGYQPPAEWFNWLANRAYLWFVWLDAFESTFHEWTAGQDFQAGIQVETPTPGTTAVFATGNTTGAGVYGQGGTTSGIGVAGQGGSPGGVGVQGTGYGAGAGVKGVGGVTNGSGVLGLGTIDGSGVVGVGGGYPATHDGFGGSFFAAGTGTGVQAIGGSTDGAGGDFQGQGDGAGAYATGSGSGSGLVAQGGATGYGIEAAGGAAGAGGLFNGYGGAPGIIAYSDGTSAIEAFGASGEASVYGEAAGAGYGIYGHAGASGIGALFVGSSTSAIAIKSNGSIDFSGATDVSKTTPIVSRLTKALTPKAWAVIDTSIGPADCYVEGAGIATIVADTPNTRIRVTLAQAMFNPNFAAIVQYSTTSYPGYTIVTAAISSTVLDIYIVDTANAYVDPMAHFFFLSVVFFGYQ